MAALSSDVLLLFGGDSNLRRPFGMLANYLLVENMRGFSSMPMGSRSGSNRITRHVDAPWGRRPRATCRLHAWKDEAIPHGIL